MKMIKQASGGQTFIKEKSDDLFICNIFSCRTRWYNRTKIHDTKCL